MDMEDTQVVYDDSVSWQSAFWALVPIALNSVAQPCGRVQGYPSRYAYLWKISPIVCFFDAVYLSIDFVFNALEKGSLCRAAQHIRQKRFYDVEPASERNSLGKLQENVAFRTGAFLFGVIPQTVKLYSMRGIPWTQVWGSMFLGSFLMTEAILILLRKYSSPVPSDPGPDKKECIIGVLTVNASFTLSAWALIYSLSWSADETRAMNGRISLIIGGACAVSVHLGCFILSTRRFAQALLFISSFVAFATVIVLWHRIHDLLRPVQVIIGMAHTLIIQAAIWASLPALPGLNRPSPDSLIDEARQSQLGFGLYFLLLHSLSAISFNAFGYSTAGTYKPSWSNQLG